MAIDKTGSTENIDSYKRVREPLSPRKACFKRNIKVQKSSKHNCLKGFLFFRKVSKNT
jgi:hypothetical protein